jgi:thioredoxin reductase (NADPH)
MGAMLAERWLSLNGLGEEFQQTETPEVETPKSTPPQNTTSENFDIQNTRHIGGYALRKLYHDSDRLIMVKYSSPTCGPCHALKPILDKVVAEFEGKIHYIEIDIEEDPEIAQNAGVVGTPTVQFFKNKDLIENLKGVKPKSLYRELIEKNS